MTTTWNKVLWFAAGAAIGTAATWNFFKTKYERIAQEEIDSVKRAFDISQKPEPADTPAPNEPVDEGIDAAELANIIKTQGYASPVAPPITARKEVEGVSKAYVISPADFDTLDDYEAFSLIYYADGTLADEDGNPVEDVESMVGRDSLNHFGEYEDDSVHVRNDALECDFEILRDLRNYSDVYHIVSRPNSD